MMTKYIIFFLAIFSTHLLNANQNYSNQYLVGENLSYGNFSNTNFSKADLRVAAFTSSDLTQANFEDAWLMSAIFKDTNLTKANFKGAYISEHTIFAGAYYFDENEEKQAVTFEWLFEKKGAIRANWG